jgi:hypothetical protein
MAEQLVSSSPPKVGDALFIPVVLSEGTERAHVGTMTVHPSVGFRKLQMEASRMIGVPPYQMTSFLERSTHDPIRIPIDEKIDLSIVSREGGDWKLLVVVRRSRNSRSRRGRRTKASRAFAEDRKPQPEKILLRRNDASNVPVVYDFMYGPIAMTPMWSQFYQPQICDVDQRETETCWSSPEKRWLWRGTWQAPKPAKAACAVCEAAAYLAVDAAFHCCVRDEILEVGSPVRSRVGPIERPSGKRVEGCACA